MNAIQPEQPRGAVIKSFFVNNDTVVTVVVIHAQNLDVCV